MDPFRALQQPTGALYEEASQMAVLDGHLALAQIMSRGQWLAQSAQLSISPFGPDAADGVLPQLHFPEQHQLDIWGPASSSSTQSPVLSAFSDWSGKDLEGTPTSVASSVSGSVTSTPVRMGPLQHAAPLSPCSSPILCWAALTQKPAGGPPPAQQQALPSQMMPCSSTPTARRCLCAALASSPAPAAADAAARPDTAAGCSTPRGSMIPPVLPPPPAPRAPRPTARLLPLDPPPAAAEAASGPGSSGASLCAQHSMGGPSRLQQWLSQMELKLAVPAGNTASILADACPPAPKASLAGAPCLLPACLLACLLTVLFYACSQCCFMLACITACRSAADECTWQLQVSWCSSQRMCLGPTGAPAPADR